MHIALPRALQHPARVVPLSFLAAIAVGTALLSLPVSRSGGGGAPFLVAFFTATSATCVTGLAVVDTATYWSAFGQGVILALIQVGGFGIMALASLLGLLVSHRLGLRSRLLAQAETRTLGLGDVRRVLAGVAAVMVIFEVVTALLLTGRLLIGYDEAPGRAVWLGLFHAVSAFNNAGFSLYSDNLTRFVADPWVSLPIALSVIIGGIGFPVLFELRREARTPSTWTLHTRLTVGMTVLLLAGGTAVFLALEWSNPRTLGPLGIGTKLLAGFFHAVQPRTAGFNSLDYGAMREETWAVTDALMFIGGGSAGTAGGIKVTTFALLAYVILAEARSERDVVVAQRRVAAEAQRLAVAVALLGVGVVALGTLAILTLTGYPLGRVLFEVTSAFGTVGLSTGITAQLPASAHLVLIALMFVGRVGSVVAASALALRPSRRLYRPPEERPIVG